jgi:acyl carrier protein
MDYTEIKQEVQEIFRKVFDNEGLEIDDQTSAKDISKWDSLNHVILISEVEKKYSIKFDLGDLLNTRTVSDICNAVIRLSTQP